MKHAITSVQGYGFTLPLCLGSLLYVLGVVYHSAKLQGWGFPGYTGDINVNDLMILSGQPATLFWITLLNVVSCYWVQVREDEWQIIEKMDAERKTPEEEIVKAEEHFTKHFEPAKPERRLGKTLMILFVLNFGWLLWQQNLPMLITVVLGNSTGFFIAWIGNMKDYSNRLWGAGVVVIVMGVHAIGFGRYDAEHTKSVPIVIEVERDSIEGLYLFEDSKSVYVMQKGKPLKVSKDKVIHWGR